MAVFRVEKTKDYTVMSNRHLRDRSLSLKAKGLLTLMLSLPENWDYTLQGLSIICKEGIDAIREGVREVKTALARGMDAMRWVRRRLNARSGSCAPRCSSRSSTTAL